MIIIIIINEFTGWKVNSDGVKRSITCKVVWYDPTSQSRRKEGIQQLPLQLRYPMDILCGICYSICALFKCLVQACTR